jgi:REase_DpnII-MboI
MPSKPQLTLSREDASKLITHFYKKGRFHILMPSTRGFKETETSLKKWSADVKEFLLSAFTTSEIADTFIACAPDIVFSGETDERKLQDFIERALMPKVDYLEKLGATLATYDTPREQKIDALEIVHRICTQFNVVVRQLRRRYDGRDTLNVSDEHDAQDLLHALLKIFFEDVRPEECSPSYAGGASRIDFLLKAEQILIELKMTRPNLKEKRLGEELIIDIECYKTHPDCKHLYCFVYDPDSNIRNPRGIEADLSRKDGPFPVTVFIAPK